MPSNWSYGVPPMDPADVKAAVERVEPHVRPVALLAADPGPFDAAALYLAAESAQITGSFKVRGAVNFAAYHVERHSMPAAGVALADPAAGNAALACAWAARETDTRATVFTGPGCTAGALTRLRTFGAEVRMCEGNAAAAARAARDFARANGALLSHTHDHPLVVAGAGTLAAEINAAVGSDIDTVVVPVVGAALFAGTCAALEHTGIRIVAVEPRGRRNLANALEAARKAGLGPHPLGTDDDAPLGLIVPTPGITPLAVDLSRDVDCVAVSVTPEEVDRTRLTLWRQRRLAVEPAAAMALAAIQAGAYVPDTYERVVVVLTGGNTDPADLTAG
ncbi:MAG TPA: pyridoxal-phosphate dependent enzyme [Actinocrinis sp.]|nr:pyridoxal-phosphate dependent enzyme [Actinocrinis sp.]